MSVNKSITLQQILGILNEGELSRVNAEATVLSAISKLRENQFEEVILVDTSKASRGQERRSKFVAISGYSVISRLLEAEPSHYTRLLNSPCLDAALEIGTVSGESDLLSLFHVYESTTFGQALIHDNSGKIAGKISVKELCKLYQRNVLSSSLVSDDVASSPVFSLPKSATLRQTLKEMESRKFRRVQITGSKLIVSDKQILSHVFGETRFKAILKAPEHLLEGTLEDAKLVPTLQIDGKLKLYDAAKLLGDKELDCLLTDRGIVTPWDLIIKPWRLGELRVSDKIN